MTLVITPFYNFALVSIEYRYIHTQVHTPSADYLPLICENIFPMLPSDKSGSGILWNNYLAGIFDISSSSVDDGI